MFHQRLIFYVLIIYAYIYVMIYGAMEIDVLGYKLVQELDLKLKGACLDFSSSTDRTTYTWCYAKSLSRTIINENNEEEQHVIGNYLNLANIGAELQVFLSDTADCDSDENIVGSDILEPGEFHTIERSGVVALRCCNIDYLLDKYVTPLEEEIYIESVEEREPCTYSVVVCSTHVCDVERAKYATDREEVENWSPQGAVILSGLNTGVEDANSKSDSHPDVHTSNELTDIEEEFVFDDDAPLNSPLEIPTAAASQPRHSMKSILEEDIESSSSIEEETLNSGSSGGNGHTKRASSSENTDSKPNSNTGGIFEQLKLKTMKRFASQEKDPLSTYKENIHILSRKEQLKYREQVRAMFYHGYNHYMKYALPSGELRPISCTGGPFELIKIPYVSLIDALDTLIIMGDDVEFRNAVHILEKGLNSFDFDVNVSVFETTIRLLGGLLSAHLFAIDPKLNVYVSMVCNYVVIIGVCTICVYLYICFSTCQLNSLQEQPLAITMLVADVE